jgi:hypothetical protein
MKYLHDNGFRVLTLTQLRYDPMNNVFYIKKVPFYVNGTATNATTLIRGPLADSNYLTVTLFPLINILLCG